jgi:branched-chain amino acid aminotransferase
MQVYLNDRLVPASEAKISVFDHGFLYGDGIYETLRVYDGVVFMIDEHMKRLLRSASFIGLTLPKTPDEMKNSIYETLQANGHRDAYLRLTISRGEGPVGLDPELCPFPTYFVLSEPLKPYPKRYYDEGIRLSITSTRRNLKEALNPQVKSLNFLNNILAKIEAKRAGADEALMLNREGYLAEGTVSNIFFVRDGTLCTPSIHCGILDGITRNVVLDLARRLDIKIHEGEFTPDDLLAAREVFITSTIMEVMAVGMINNTPFKPGEMTRSLAAQYSKEVDAYVQNIKSSGPSLWGFTE